MFLIDTMVLSELRLRKRDQGVVNWIGNQRQENCYLSVVSIGEIERGITRKPGLIQSLSQGLLPELSAWVEVGGIAPSLCLKAPPLQPIST